MRPGQAKGPFVGVSSGGSGGGTASPIWYDLGEFTFEDFSADSLEFPLSVLILPANAVFYGVLIVPTTAFVNAGAAFYNLRVGITGTEDLYLPDYAVLGLAPGDTIFGFGGIANGHIASLAGWSVFVTAESDSGLDGASAGAFNLFVQYAIVP